MQRPEGPAAGHVPRVAFFQDELAAELGLDRDDVGLFAGAETPPADACEPVALAYAGHQFGNLAMLGDGRAVLLGGRDSARGVLDVQLKGSGRTPFSRGGDGRAALGPMLREALFSEAMHALGVPTTRTLAVVTHGREADRRGLPPAWSGEGAVLTRVAASHLRVGTFVLAAHLGPEALAATLDEAIRRHDPDLAGLPVPERALAFLKRVIGRQAALVAQWMSLGFVHGVLNTDNVAVSGETIDYGPCAFINGYVPGAVFSSIDRAGRYRLGAQPSVTAWNLARLAEALLPLLAETPEAGVASAEDALDGFGSAYEQAFHARLGVKLGLPGDAGAGDAALFTKLFDAMQADRLDWTRTFRRLAGEGGDASLGSPALAAWLPRWRTRLGAETDRMIVEREERMLAVNPATVPRSHHAAAALTALLVDGDRAAFGSFLGACRTPFTQDDRWSAPPPADAAPVPTFCGT